MQPHVKACVLCMDVLPSSQAVFSFSVDLPSLTKRKLRPRETLRRGCWLPIAKFWKAKSNQVMCMRSMCCCSCCCTCSSVGSSVRQSALPAAACCVLAARFLLALAPAPKLYEPRFFGRGPRVKGRRNRLGPALPSTELPLSPRGFKPRGVESPV